MYAKVFLAYHINVIDFIAVSCTQNQHQIPYKYIYLKATFSLRTLYLKRTPPAVYVRLQCRPIRALYQARAAALLVNRRRYPSYTKRTTERLSVGNNYRRW